jgi:hypothetical protein
MTVRRFVIPISVDASGDAEEYSPTLSGRLVSIRYVKTDFADGVDFTITSEDTGETIWAEENVNASASRYPRAATHSTAGAASLYAALGEAVNGKIALSQDRIKFVVASGGVSKSGAFHILIDG